MPSAANIADCIGRIPYRMAYQDRYAGAMYSGCGGGYLYVVSEELVPGALRVNIRVQ